MSWPKLEHYSEHGIDNVLSFASSQEWLARKPRGLWLSVPGVDDWPNWCRREEYCLEGLAVRQRVTLHADAGVLWIKNTKMLDEFHDGYGVGAERFDRHSGIRWNVVAQRWDGIIISPYQWLRRLDGAASNWYYGWDVASACIWNPDAIASVEGIEESRYMRSHKPTPAEVAEEQLRYLRWQGEPHGIVPIEAGDLERIKAAHRRTPKVQKRTGDKA